MALVPQNGDGDVADANSYITLQFFKDYHTARGNNYSAFDDTAIEQAIVRAWDYIDTRFAFKGIRETEEQTTEWPRVAAAGVLLKDPAGRDIDGLPVALQRAQAEYAFRALTIPLYQDAPAPEGGKEILSESVQVDVIAQSRTYESGYSSGGFVMPAFPQADMLLVRAGLVNSLRELYR